MIAVSGLSKSYGPQTLFEEVSLQLNAGCRYGLVGANGSGKSTFLRLLAGEEPPSDGTVSIPKRARVGVLEQDHFRYEDRSVLHVVMMGRQTLWRAIEEKERLLAESEEHFDGERYAELEDFILQHDGYAFEARAAEILEGLGIPSERHHEPLAALSGGFKLRALLGKVLAADPEVLLLDEPTNHLDILSIRWLERFLESFGGCAVVISHDHRFLDNVCTHVLDVDYQTITLYHGNYADFARAKVEERERKEAEIARREREIAEHQASIDRFRAKATKARQAQSKQKLLDRVVLEPLPQSSRQYPRFRFVQCRPSGKVVLELEEISKAFGRHRVLDDVSLTVHRGDRVAVIGPNGIGKSTLLKIAMGKLAADRGSVEWGYETYPGYFAQDHREQLGDDDRQTVESWLWRSCPGESVGFVRGRLGLVLFSGDEVHKRIGALSGGEAARLIFARLGIEQPNVLVLDEPTNHLDLEAIEALVMGLEEYDGTLLFVSHDRWFVSRLANRIVEITSLGLEDFRGRYEEYLERCGDDHLDRREVELRARRERRRERDRRPRSRGKEDPGPRRRRRRLVSRREEITAAIEEAEERVHAINELFVSPGYFDRTAPDEVRRLEREQKELSARVEELMGEWEGLEAELTEVGTD